jgi:MFS family permease
MKGICVIKWHIFNHKIPPTSFLQREELSKERVMKNLLKKSAIQFIILLGVADLFADLTYEGARSITGPYLALLGASATAVGIVAGLGELIGYGFRFVSGYLGEKTGRYWLVTLLGYLINMSVVPLLALAGRWEVAAALMIAERFGKAIRSPIRDAMLSHAAQTVGRGWGFGLHEAMDQIGATVGPLVVAAVLFKRHSYPQGFAILAIPAVLNLSALLIARFRFPNPRDLETTPARLQGEGLPRTYWIFLLGAALIAAGYADFSLIAYHFQKRAILSPTFIPVSYSLAMGVAAMTALLFGFLFDRKGMIVIILASFASLLFAPLVFLGGSRLVWLGMILWGLGMGAQESVFKAAVSLLVTPERRASAFGIFSTGFGVFWFLGSALMGLLYDHSLRGLVIFSVAAQFLSLPFFILSALRMARNSVNPS